MNRDDWYNVIMLYAFAQFTGNFLLLVILITVLK
jgi:hypothetical protein